jgi:FMN reductase
MKITVVVGNPKAASRTSKVAELVADGLAEKLGADRAATVDLATVASQLFEWPNAHLAALNESVAASDVVVFASPTYKATYTALLKAFLDRYANLALESVIAIPVMTGAGAEHAMAPDLHLRPLLVELGASVPTSSLYFIMTQMAQAEEIVASWLTRNGQVLARLGSGPR